MIHSEALAIIRLTYIIKLNIATVILANIDRIVKKKNSFANIKQAVAIFVFVLVSINTSNIVVLN